MGLFAGVGAVIIVHSFPRKILRKVRFAKWDAISAVLLRPYSVMPTPNSPPPTLIAGNRLKPIRHSRKVPRALRTGFMTRS